MKVTLEVFDSVPTLTYYRHRLYFAFSQNYLLGRIVCYVGANIRDHLHRLSTTHEIHPFNDNRPRVRGSPPGSFRGAGALKRRLSAGTARIASNGRVQTKHRADLPPRECKSHEKPMVSLRFHGDHSILIALLSDVAIVRSCQSIQI